MMIIPHNRIVSKVFLVSSAFVGLLTYGFAAPVLAQVLPPLNDPTPGSTLTTTTVTFTGGDAGQTGEQHWLSVETSPYANDIFHESLGTEHTATVSGLPTSGTLYVRYHTYTPVAGWNAQAHTYRMNVETSGGNTSGNDNNSGGGNSGGNGNNSGGGNSDGNDNNSSNGTGESNHTLRWDRKLDSTNGVNTDGFEGCNSDRFKCIFEGTAVVDMETGLVWERFPAIEFGNSSWGQAIADCAKREVGGRKGWSLPMREQLASLVDRTGTGVDLNGFDLKLPNGHPFVVWSGGYYSATEDAEDPTQLWGVRFADGAVVKYPKSYPNSHVWCVRGGQVYDGQNPN